MPPPDTLTTVYATDEHVAIREPGDFAVLCPDWQRLAYGKDGAFARAAPWDLASASVDFEAQGVVAGMVVALTAPRSTFRGSGELLAVGSASGGSLSLRRIGQAPGVGSPPAADDLAAVEFTVATLGPQIEEASYSLNRRFNIDPARPGRTPADLYDLRDLREATVLTVLLRRYVSEARTDRGDFPLKIKAYGVALDEVTARLEVRWGAASDAPPSSLVTMRVVR